MKSNYIPAYGPEILGHTIEEVFDWIANGFLTKAWWRITEEDGSIVGYKPEEFIKSYFYWQESALSELSGRIEMMEDRIGNLW